MSRSASIRTAAGCFAVLSLACSAIAAPLRIDAGKSTVSVVFRQMNVPVEATFRKFTARIDFDVAKPADAKASIDIDVPSFDLGDAGYNRDVLKKEWFDAAQFPKASFVASMLRENASAPAGTGYDVAGKLTIKGKTADVHFPLTVRQDRAGQTFDGAFAIKRLAFNIGEGEWKDTGMVADEVTIRFHVVTTSSSQ
ncbi:MAG: YceI family protein [Herbaspirillum sp.]